MPNPETLLKELGLTEYEAKAYIVLTAKGDLTAERVSVMAKIPLPRVYDTMAALSEKGLVIVTKTRPQKFTSIGPEKVLDLIKENAQRKLDDKFKKMDQTMPQILSSIEKVDATQYSEKPDTLSYVKRRVSVEAIWNDIHRRAKKSILMFANDLYWSDESRALIRKTIKKGIKYKIIWMKDTKKILPRLNRLKSTGVQMRFNKDLGLLRGSIIDNRWTVLFQYPEQQYIKGESNEEQVDQKIDFTTLIISNRLISTTFAKYFDILWKNGLAIDKFTKKYK